MWGLTGSFTKAYITHQLKWPQSDLQLHRKFFQATQFCVCVSPRKFHWWIKWPWPLCISIFLWSLSPLSECGRGFRWDYSPMSTCLIDVVTALTSSLRNREISVLASSQTSVSDSQTSVSPWEIIFLTTRAVQQRNKLLPMGVSSPWLESQGCGEDVPVLGGAAEPSWNLRTQYLWWRNARGYSKMTPSEGSVISQWAVWRRKALGGFVLESRIQWKMFVWACATSI